MARRPNISFDFWMAHFHKNGSRGGGGIPVPEPPHYLLGIWTSLYLVIFVVGLVGNTAVTFVVLRCRSMHTFINFLFLNLCIADLMVLMISGPTAVVDMYAREVWYLGKFMCEYGPGFPPALSFVVSMLFLDNSLRQLHGVSMVQAFPSAFSFVVSMLFLDNSLRQLHVIYLSVCLSIQI